MSVGSRQPAGSESGADRDLLASQMSTASDAGRYRFERKFVAGVDRNYVESIVRFHPALFRTIFHRRWINNIYLDTWSLASYDDNLAGSSHDRVKVRIRWYGDIWGAVEKPVLELKIKHNLVNRKESFPLEPFEMSDRVSARQIHAMFARAELPNALRHDLCKLRPTLLNRYQRVYYRTADRSFRITVDWDLAFYGMTGAGSVDKGIHRKGGQVILELKYAQDVAVRAQEITQHLPFRLSRSSKYVGGIDRTRAHLGLGNLGV